LPYVCPNIIPYLFEKHNKKFEEEEEEEGFGGIRQNMWLVYFNGVPTANNQ
jgi:hypothetical protein